MLFVRTLRFLRSGSSELVRVPSRLASSSFHPRFACSFASAAVERDNGDLGSDIDVYGDVDKSGGRSWPTMGVGLVFGFGAAIGCARFWGC